MVVRWPAGAVLVVCADAGTRDRVARELTRRLHGVEVLEADGPMAAWTCLGSSLVEVLVLDDCLDEAAFREALRVRWPSMPVVRLSSDVVSGCGGEVPAGSSQGSQGPEASAASEASAAFGLARRFEARARRGLPSHRRDEMVGPDSSHR